jgi:hypothetical protein
LRVESLIAAPASIIDQRDSYQPFCVLAAQTLPLRCWKEDQSLVVVKEA